MHSRPLWEMIVSLRDVTIAQMKSYLILSYEDPDNPLYNPNSQDKESDESSECGDSDSSESSTSDDLPQPNVN